MRSLSSAIAFLLFIRIAYASTEEDENPSSGSIFPEDCAEEEECLKQLCLRFIRLCHDEIDCNPEISDCLHLLSNTPEGTHEKEKKGSISKNSYLLMKLHPVLNRAIDANLLDLPTRYRRIGVRLGSEFLGKRSERGEEELMRFSGTELLGKRFGSEMLGKREVEFLGKRGNEFLGKRGNEFLGKRGNEFLGKRGNEFLGKRGNEFLGKRGNEFLGKRSRMRMRNCQMDESNCFNRKLISDSNIFAQYFKITEKSQVEDPEKEFQNMNNSPNRF